jgi:Zn-finger nucleic acid-binding protein
MTAVFSVETPGGLCPRRRQELVVMELADLEIEGCSRCGGLWLDIASANRVVESMHAAAALAAEAASSSAAEGKTDRPE